MERVDGQTGELPSSIVGLVQKLVDGLEESEPWNQQPDARADLKKHFHRSEDGRNPFWRICLLRATIDAVKNGRIDLNNLSEVPLDVEPLSERNVYLIKLLAEGKSVKELLAAFPVKRRESLLEPLETTENHWRLSNICQVVAVVVSRRLVDLHTPGVE